jgi:hypothetical protein
MGLAETLFATEPVMALIGGAMSLTPRFGRPEAAVASGVPPEAAKMCESPDCQSKGDLSVA